MGERFVVSKANIEGCYRYSLDRVWGETKYNCLWIMLNPSIADADIDDPTIRRCLRFSENWGFDELTVVNLFAYRATRPTDLWKSELDIVGPKNYECVQKSAEEANMIVCAWGGASDPRVNTQVKVFWDIIHDRNPMCLGTTKSGAPRHPLYLAKNTELIPFTPV